jgi:hypothetical protein
MTASEKAKVIKLMKSRYGLISKACTAAGFPRDTYYNAIRGNSTKNIPALNQIIKQAKKIKSQKVQVEI